MSVETRGRPTKACVVGGVLYQSITEGAQAIGASASRLSGAIAHGHRIRGMVAYRAGETPPQRVDKEARNARILDLVATGLSHRQIAEQVGVSRSLVSSLVYHKRHGKWG